MKTKKKFLLFSLAAVFWLLFSLGLHVLIWIAFVPIFLLLLRLKGKELIYYSTVYSFLVGIFTFHWISFFNLKLFALSAFLTSLVCFLFLTSSLFLMQRVKKYSVLAPPILFLLLQLLFSFAPSGNFFFFLSVFQPMLAPLQGMITGYGVTFFIVLSNSLIFHYIIQKRKLLLVSEIIILSIALCSFGYSATATTTGEPIKVALVQGNVNEDWFWRVDNVTHIFDIYRKLTLDIASEKPDIIIWPEYALPTDLSKNVIMKIRLSSLAKAVNATLIIGSLTELENYGIEYEAMYDSAVVFSPNGSIIATHHATFPFPMTATPGPGITTFTVKNKKIGVEVCFEEMQRIVHSEYSKENVDFVVAISNNAHFGNYPAGLLFSKSYGQAQAAEHRMYVVRASNTGITYIANPFGKVVSKIPINEESVLVYDILV